MKVLNLCIKISNINFIFFQIINYLFFHYLNFKYNAKNIFLNNFRLFIWIASFQRVGTLATKGMLVLRFQYLIN